MIKQRIRGEQVILITSLLAIVVMGAWYMFVTAAESQTVSTGEHFQVESLAQSVAPADATQLVETPAVAFDRSVFGDDIVITVYRRDTMLKIAKRAIGVFADEQHLTFEAWQSMAMAKVLAELRSGQSLRGKKTITFTHDEIAQAFEGIGELSQDSKDALTREAENIK